MSVVGFSLEGRVATVTGASRGIGEAIARAFAERGARVVLSSRKQESLEAVAASIVERGGEAVAMACHGGRPDDIEAFFGRVEDELGRLDIHVNNAATNPYFGPAIETPLRAFDKTLEVNLRGYFIMTQHAARLMAKTGGGSIINISSVAGLRPGPSEATYAITKAGVLNMTRSFAKELGSLGIRVNAIAPGVVETYFASVLVDSEEKRRAIAERLPVGRHGQPADIAGAAVFLASDASSYCTGSTIVIDGGATA
jgi:NAD(P)-dependent dehydrogenase (short-subunit alcohol dehydrogenase family)